MKISPLQKTVRKIVYLHGGGFVLGSPSTHQQHMSRIAKLCDAEVLGVDYGLSPEHPFPTAVNQVENIWKELLSRGVEKSKVVFMGDSAGANIALATTLKLRDETVALPGCVVLLSPAIDAKLSGQSYKNNASSDVVLNMQKLNFFVEMYSQGHDKNDPYLSPVYANLENLPPILSHVGNDEMLLSDSLTLEENAKSQNIKECTVKRYDGLWHSWHLFANIIPESKSAMDDINQFIRSHT